MTESPSRPLSTPVKEGDTRAIRELAAAGVPLNEAVDSLDRHEYTPLTLAVEVKNIESVKTLLDVGADVDAIDPMGRTPLEAAFIAGGKRTRHLTIEIVRELVGRGATVTERALERAQGTFDSMGKPAYPTDLIELLRNSATSASDGNTV